MSETKFLSLSRASWASLTAFPISVYFSASIVRFRPKGWKPPCQKPGAAIGWNPLFPKPLKPSSLVALKPLWVSPAEVACSTGWNPWLLNSGFWESSVLESVGGMKLGWSDMMVEKMVWWMMISQMLKGLLFGEMGLDLEFRLLIYAWIRCWHIRTHYDFISRLELDYGEIIAPPIPMTRCSNYTLFQAISPGHQHIEPRSLQPPSQDSRN